SAVPVREAVAAAAPGLSAKEERELRKELSRLERQLDKLGTREERLHASMADAAADYGRLASLDAELKEVLAEKETVETEWLELADRLGE
ncbi:ABC transporter ATP-binding protein, partial [Streptosporangium algeriense]